MKRDKRFNNQIRCCKVTTNFLSYPESSVLIRMGETKVICNVIINKFNTKTQKNLEKGGLIVEYNALHKTSQCLNTNNIKCLKYIEIQKFVYRTLQNCLDFNLILNHNILLELNVIEDDGGVRTASVNGGLIAMYLAYDKLIQEKFIKKTPIKNFVSSIAVGLIDGEVFLDLSLKEENLSSVNMNIAMTDQNEIVEIHGIGENSTFGVNTLKKMIEVAQKGNFELIETQKQILNLV